eukprot:TRINITY_DN1740_c0_g1_i4.p1 TRINITY_DN1740_c0_g1~~TRINITY_DN1740_c0_g1_i4.p1  ORF type:complete len:247 (+),score=40.36 TRINITY_DN1740_c0_g1_i4:270-1010(+)
MLKRNAEIDPLSLIRKLGCFSPELQGNPIKLAARLGQTCSKSHPTVTLNRSEIAIIPDKITGEGERKYCFTDGIGLISVKLAMRVYASLMEEELTEEDMPKTAEEEAQKMTEIPSAFQIRIAGVKGMVTVWPEKVITSRLQERGIFEKDKQILIRPSMIKFRSNSAILEVLKFSKPSRAYLNRQFIQNLEAAGISQESFIKIVKAEVSKYKSLAADPVKFFQYTDLVYNSLFKDALLVLSLVVFVL